MDSAPTLPERIEAIAERLYEHDSEQAHSHWRGWRFISIARQEEYRARAAAVADLVASWDREEAADA